MHRDVTEMGFMPKSTTYYVYALEQKIQLWEDGSNNSRAHVSIKYRPHGVCT